MTDPLARIDWKMGQTLLPEHFINQEEALLADVAARFGLAGRPFHGVGRLKWNESLLAEGILSVVALTAILPTGKVLQVPGNAKALAFNLNATGTTRVAVFLHLTNERAPTDDSEEAGEGERLDRVVHLIALSAEQTVRSATYTMRLAEFTKSLDGTWSLSPDYVPPLLQVGTTPFLEDAIDRLVKAIASFQQKLQEDIAASYLGGERLFGAKNCLKALYAFQRLLANVVSQVHLHPYDFYEAAKTFYTEVSVYHDRTPEEVTSPYRHDDLAGCLSKVVDPLVEQLQVTKGKTPYLGFEKKDGAYVVDGLPDEARAAKEVYFLLQKPRVSDVVSIEVFKLASRTRLPIVHKLSLVGIPLRRIERPPFQHQFGAEVEFFQLSPGDEWDHALRENALAFFDSPGLAKAKAFLYWRNA